MIDRFYQIIYIYAYWMMRCYWALRHPYTHGALVAIWHDGAILLVRNSYLRYYNLPGGYIHHNETTQQAAIRELAEEVGVFVNEDILRLTLDVAHEWEGRHDHVEIFEIELLESPQIRVDNREVIAADFFTPEAALKLDLFPPLRQYIANQTTNHLKNRI